MSWELEREIKQLEGSLQALEKDKGLSTYQANSRLLTNRLATAKRRLEEYQVPKFGAPMQPSEAEAVDFLKRVWNYIKDAKTQGRQKSPQQIRDMVADYYESARFMGDRERKIVRILKTLNGSRLDALLRRAFP